LSSLQDSEKNELICTSLALLKAKVLSAPEGWPRWRGALSLNPRYGLAPWMPWTPSFTKFTPMPAVCYTFWRDDSRNELK